MRKSETSPKAWKEFARKVDAELKPQIESLRNNRNASLRKESLEATLAVWSSIVSGDPSTQTGDENVVSALRNFAQAIHQQTGIRVRDP